MIFVIAKLIVIIMSVETMNAYYFSNNSYFIFIHLLRKESIFFIVRILLRYILLVL